MLPRIALSLPHGLTIGGVTTWSLNVACWAAERGQPVSLFFHAPLDGHREISLPEKIHHHHLIEVNHLPALESALDECVAAYAERMPMILLPSCGDASYQLAATLRRLDPARVRVLAVAHGDNGEDYDYLTRHEPVIDRYIGVSTRIAEELKDRLPLRSREISFLPHGVVIPPSVRRDALTNRPIRLLYAGRIEQGIKRVVDLLALAWLLTDHDARFEMLLVGDGPHAGMIDARIADLSPTLARHGSIVRRINAVAPDAMSEWYAWADIFILASRLEGMNVAMLEAMAASCVPIVTDIASGARDVITPGANGFLFPVGGIDEALDHVLALAKDPDSLMKVGQRARDTIASDFTERDYIQRFTEVIADTWARPVRQFVDDAPPQRHAPAHDEHGAVLSCKDARYESLLGLLRAHPEIKNIVVYGLGVNGLTLLDHLRRDDRLADYQLFVADDHVHAAIFRVVCMPRVFPMGWPELTSNTLVVVTPNEGRSIFNRLVGRGARPGTNVVLLNQLAPRSSAAEQSNVVTA